MVEILFAVAIMSSFIGLLVLALMFHLQIATAGPKHTAAVFLAEEGIEAVKSIRGRGWFSGIEEIECGVPFFLYVSENEWRATTTEQITDGTFIRKMRLEEVRRDENNRIAEEGILDPGTRLVNVEVTWDGLMGRSKAEMSAYVTNIFE